MLARTTTSYALGLGPWQVRLQIRQDQRSGNFTCGHYDLSDRSTPDSIVWLDNVKRVRDDKPLTTATGSK